MSLIPTKAIPSDWGKVGSTLSFAKDHKDSASIGLSLLESGVENGKLSTMDWVGAASGALNSAEG